MESRVPTRPVDAADGGWPNTFLDIADGIDHLREIAEQHKLDLGNVIVTGDSPGGHLALWAAGRRRIPRSSVLYRSEPLPIGSVVGLAGIGDLEAARPIGISVCGRDVVEALLGGSPDEVPENYAAGSPVHLLPLGVPQRLLTGKADESAPPWLGNAYAARARQTGGDVEAVTLDGAAHFEVIAPGSVVWEVVRRRLSICATLSWTPTSGRCRTMSWSGRHRGFVDA